ASFSYYDSLVPVRTTSLWWRDLLTVGGESDSYWFFSNLSNILGDGFALKFWKEKWLGMDTLKDLFPSLFAKSTAKNAVVAELGRWAEEGWVWELSWVEKLSYDEVVTA
ncbi:ribonuclease H protein, partial [Trifolium medium]|nr:ribonuclease H protein [Trifolium medium]